MLNEEIKYNEILEENKNLKNLGKELNYELDEIYRQNDNLVEKNKELEKQISELN